MSDANIELLDDFAAAAMVGLLSGPHNTRPLGARYIALEAYQMALEMLKAREEIIKSIKEQADG
jgi:hypothetical protein